MNLIKIEFNLIFQEDFHIGAGIGQVGYCDELQSKDENGNPDLKPSDTFKGLIRQSAEELKKWEKLFSNEKIKVEKYFDDIFNYKMLASLDISLDFDVEGNKNIENLYRIHSFTAIDENNGKAKEHSLRNIEFGSKGLKYKGKIELLCDKEKTECDNIIKLMEYILKNIKEMGGYRRRGFGKIIIDGIKGNIIDLIPGIEKTDNKIIGIELILEDDVTIGKSSEGGNHTPTHDYIQGKVILGMLRNVQRINKKSEKYLDDTNIFCSNFYPVPEDQKTIEDNAIIIPTAKSMKQIKKSEKYIKSPKDKPCWMYSIKNDNKFINNVLKDEMSLTDNESEYKPKSIENSYIYCTDKKNIKAENCTIYSVKTKNVLRNKIDINTQTSSGSEGSLFSEERLLKGQIFYGTIEFNSIEDADKFLNDYAPFLNGIINLHVGRGNKPIKINKIYTEMEEKNNNDIKFIENNNKKYFSLTLISDAILYDTKLKPKTAIDKEIIALEFGIEENDIELIKEFCSSNIIQRFLPTSGLRGFSELSIEKGSCALFEYKGENENEFIEKIKSKSRIGFRKNEGFGQFIINLPLHFENFENKNNFEFSSEEKIITDREKKRVKKNNKIFEQATGLFNSFNQISSSKIGRLYKKFDYGVSLEDIENFLKHNSEKQEGEEYKRFLDKYNGMKNDPNIYEIMKLYLLMMKQNNKGGEKLEKNI